MYGYSPVPNPRSPSIPSPIKRRIIRSTSLGLEDERNESSSSLACYKITQWIGLGLFGILAASTGTIGAYLGGIWDSKFGSKFCINIMINYNFPVSYIILDISFRRSPRK